MSWTKEDTAKLLELHTACMTAKEIAKKMGKPADFIRDELKSRGYEPIEKHPKAESEFLKGFKPVEIKRKPYAKISTNVEKRVCELREQRHTTTQIATTLNISPQTVSNILQRNGYSTKRGEYHKLSLEDITETKEDKPVKVNEEFDKAVNEMIAEAKEKEPVTSANDTSSEVETLECVSISNDNISAKKSQSLTGVKMLGVLEDLLHELYKEQVEITSLNADTDLASIKFNLNGGQYWVSFGPQQETPIYGKEG